MPELELANTLTIWGNRRNSPNYNYGIDFFSFVGIFFSHLVHYPYVYASLKPNKLLQGFHQLKYINLSGTYGISGCFLRFMSFELTLLIDSIKCLLSNVLSCKRFDGRDLGVSCKDSPLQTLLLRDCYHLKEVLMIKPRGVLLNVTVMTEY